MAIYITPQTEIKEYYLHPNVSQSNLKLLLKGLDYYKKKQKEEDKEEEYFTIGSAVDLILTGEETDFSNEYHISDFDDQTSDVEKTLIKNVFNSYTIEDVKNVELEDCFAEMELAAIEENWFKGKPGEKRILSLLKRGSSYFEDLKMAFGKKVLTPAQNLLVTNIVESLRSDPYTSKYFNRTLQSSEVVVEQWYDKVDFYYQNPMYWSSVLNKETIDVKGLMDLVIVFKLKDKVVKVVPVDIKTMSGPVTEFDRNLRKYRYDIQAAWYTWGLQKKFGKDVVASFLFIVESTTDIGNPLIYEVSKELLKIGRYGRSEIRAANDAVLSYGIKGFEQLLTEYMYYTNQGWERDVRLKDYDEVIKLDWNGIKEKT